MDERGVLTFVNRQAYELTGYTEEDFKRGFNAVDLMAPEDRPKAVEGIARMLRGERGLGWEYKAVRKDGSTFLVTSRAMPVVRGGKVVGVRGILIDITELRRAEEALRQSEENYRAIFDAAGDAIIVHDIETGAAIDANKAALELYGYSRDEIRGVRIGDGSEGVSPYSDRDAVERIRAAAAGEPQFFEWRGRRKDGSLMWLEVSLKRVAIAGCDRVVSVIRNIDARKRLEEELRQAQKMEAIGRLAGGVAHDFNNLLAAILGYAEKLITESHEADPRRDALECIQRAGSRAAALTRQLLAFSRKQVLEMRVLDLNAVVRQVAAMVERLIGEHIRVVISPADDLGSVSADVVQVEQVILNLALNARDAMPSGGTLTIATANACITGSPAGGVPAGDYVMLSVTDTGSGMDDSAREHLFEPFFTTKDAERGTGLGLSTVYGIVRQHSGHISVDSAPGSGTTFSVYLPRVPTGPSAERRHPPASPATGCGETILLVEDDVLVRSMIADILRNLDYFVLEASRPSEALALAAGHEGRIPLLLTDIVMPGADGCELYDRLRESREGMKVVYISGYADDEPLRRRLHAGVNFLQKPFTIAALAATVRDALSR